MLSYDLNRIEYIKAFWMLLVHGLKSWTHFLSPFNNADFLINLIYEAFFLLLFCSLIHSRLINFADLITDWHW